MGLFVEIKTLQNTTLATLCNKVTYFVHKLSGTTAVTQWTRTLLKKRRQRQSWGLCTQLCNNNHHESHDKHVPSREDRLLMQQVTFCKHKRSGKTSLYDMACTSTEHMLNNTAHELSRIWLPKKHKASENCLKVFTPSAPPTVGVWRQGLTCEPGTLSVAERAVGSYLRVGRET